jgi:hypothetical protein
MASEVTPEKEVTHQNQVSGEKQVVGPNEISREKEVTRQSEISREKELTYGGEVSHHKEHIDQGASLGIDTAPGKGTLHNVAERGAVATDKSVFPIYRNRASHLAQD